MQRPHPGVVPYGQGAAINAMYEEEPQALGSEATGVDIGTIVRKNLWIGIICAILGLIGGAASVVLSKPIYKARVLLEVQGVNDAWLKGSFEQSSSYSADQINIQTQITLLTSGPFLRRVQNRLQTETVPPSPTQADIFSKIRRRLFPEIQDPMQVMTEGLNTAFGSFNARAVNGTRLIELSCDSTNPQMAAQFINTMANEYISETMFSRSQSSQRTNEWLASQIEEIKLKLQEAEQREQEFVRRSGDLFVSQNGTLEDTKLAQLQAELSAMTADRISKQTRYETVTKAPPDLLPQLLEDSSLAGIQQNILDLERQKASLEVTLMPAHKRVQQVTQQIATLESGYKERVGAATERLRADYEAAKRKEQLLSSAYSTQARRVGAMSGKSAENNALRREVETLRQMYQTMLLQSNQAGISTSVPVNPIRLVEPSEPPPYPYKPQPILNLTFGAMSGLFFAAGIAFVRLKMDRSVQHPAHTEQLLHVRELGVIPYAPTLAERSILETQIRKLIPARVTEADAARTWSEEALLADSFRGALASLMGGANGAAPPRMIAVTSPSPGEGKTTISSNLAIALAEAGRRVLIVDADFRRPRLHSVFNLDHDRALVDAILDDDIPVEQAAKTCVFPANFANLSVAVNRPRDEDIARVLYSPRLAEVLNYYRTQYDVVIVDTAPLLGVTDTRLIAPITDGIVLVLRSGITERDAARDATRRIMADGLPLLGTILNHWKPNKRAMQRYYHGYTSR